MVGAIVCYNDSKAKTPERCTSKLNLGFLVMMITAYPDILHGACGKVQVGKLCLILNLFN